MAETTKIGVEFTATTAAAVSDINNLTAAVREQTTAATVAGSAQAQLGKDVALTRTKVLESVEAAKASKQALENLALTEQAFGKDSREAAAAAEKLAAAEREAAKAATTAAEALQRTAREVHAVATAEDGKLSPATKRAAAEVAKMGETAQKTAADLNRMELQGKATARATEEKLMRATERAGAEMVRMHGTTSKVEKALQTNAYATQKGAAGFDVMGFASSKLMSVLGPAALGGTLVAVAGWIGDAAEATHQYETAIANLPFSLEGATAATRGLVSQQTLVSAASLATSLKVTRTAEDFELLAGASVKLAAKLGQPADQLLNNLVTALGRGSTELLDNAGVVLKTSEAQERYAAAIGISVDKLSDEQKASAFKVEAFKAIVKAADETTVAFDSNAAAVARFKVSVGDSWDSIERGTVNAVGSMLSTVTGAVDQIVALEKAAAATAGVVDTSWSPAFTSGASAVGNWAANILVCNDALEQMQRIALDPTNLAAFDAANAKEREKRDILSEEADFAERQSKALLASEKANESFLDAQAAASIVYGPAEAPKKKKAGKKKAEAEFSSNSGTNAIVRGYDGTEDTAVIAAAAPEAAAAGVAEQAQAVFDKREELATREMELLDAQGRAEADRVDLLFGTIEVEDELETRRAELQDQKLKREMDYARWQATNARTAAQREQATTRLEELEHRKRVLGLQRTVADEQKTLAARQATVEKVTGHVTGLADALVQGLQAAAEGEKGAIAKSIGSHLEGVAIRMGMKGIEETVLVAASAASFNPVGVAAHGTAAAMAFGAAAAAGGAAAGFNAAGNAAAGSVGDSGTSRAPVGATGTAAQNSGSAPDRQPLERMEVPISYKDVPASTGPSVVINIQNYVGGKDSEKALAATVQRSLTQNKAVGARP